MASKRSLGRSQEGIAVPPGKSTPIKKRLIQVLTGIAETAKSNTVKLEACKLAMLLRSESATSNVVTSPTVPDSPTASNPAPVLADSSIDSSIDARLADLLKRTDSPTEQDT